MRTSRLCCPAVVLGLASLGLFPAGALASSGITGAGSTLVAPLVAEWSAAFEVFHDVGLAYFPSGSQAGIRDVSARTVDFGMSEAPMTLAQQGACNGCYQIPCALTGIGVGYHVNGLGRSLYLNGKVLAQIYLGEITRWNDPRIKALNPRASLPRLKIVPIYLNASGSTYTFTLYLSRSSSTWRARVGSGLSVSFPTGVPADISTATTLLESTNGSITYLGAAYLIGQRLPAAAIENSAGFFVYPNLTEIESAGRSVKHVPATNALDIVDPPKTAPSAYPLATYVYMIVPANAPQKSLLGQWVSYVLGGGQAFGASLDYAPLPANVLRASERTASRFMNAS